MFERFWHCMRANTASCSASIRLLAGAPVLIGGHVHVSNSRRGNGGQVGREPHRDGGLVWPSLVTTNGAIPSVGTLNGTRRLICFSCTYSSAAGTPPTLTAVPHNCLTSLQPWAPAVQPVSGPRCCP